MTSLICFYFAPTPTHNTHTHTHTSHTHTHTHTHTRTGRTLISGRCRDAAWSVLWMFCSLGVRDSINSFALLSLSVSFTLLQPPLSCPTPPHFPAPSPHPISFLTSCISPGPQALVICFSEATGSYYLFLRGHRLLLPICPRPQALVTYLSEATGSCCLFVRGHRLLLSISRFLCRLSCRRKSTECQTLPIFRLETVFPASLATEQ